MPIPLDLMESPRQTIPGFITAPRSERGRCRNYSAAVTGIEEAMSIKYNTMVYDLQRQGKKVLVMSLGEAFFDLPLFSFKDLPFPDLYHYSHSRGLYELREKLGNYLDGHYDVPVDPESEILVTAGSKAAVQMAFMAILNPGDEVLLPEPAWVSYSEQIKLCHAQPVGVPVSADTCDIEEFITHRTRAIVITTPHNPRGYVYSERELAHLLKLADKYDLWLLSDEAYSDFVLDGRFVSLGSLDREKRRSIVFNSISKNFGISGWRIGYVVSHEEVIAQILKINQHLITCPPTILSHYVARHFDRILEITRPQIQAVVERRNQLATYLDEIGLDCLPGGATFYFFISIAPSKLTSEEFCTRLLEEESVSAVPGVGYGQTCDRFIRVSVGTLTLDEARQGLHRIKSLIDRTSPVQVVHRRRSQWQN